MHMVRTFLFGRRYDVPLDQDSGSKVLPWIIALMVYLASLSLTATMTVSGLIGQWNADVAGTLTVQVPPAHNEGRERSIETDPRLKRIIAILQAQPAIQSATPLPQDQMDALMAPWLGTGDFSRELPMPWLIDVEIDRTQPLDLDNLGMQLDSTVPGVTIEDHQVWLKDLIVFARSIEVIALLILFLVTLAGVTVVVFSTRAGFDIHRNVVEALHMMGATDAYIAGQFQTHAFGVGLRGGLIGLGMALVTLLVATYFAAQINSTLMPSFSPSWLLYLCLAFMPLASAVITMYAARATVMRNLNALP